MMRKRILAAYDELKKNPMVDPSKIGAIGYCFGGTAVLELARSGADVKGVVSFHGGLGTPDSMDAFNIKGKVLICRGAEDPFVQKEEVEAFQKEMSNAKVPVRMEVYPGAVHSFTVREAGDDPSTGMAYDPEADRRSWEAMKDFFKEVFGI